MRVMLRYAKPFVLAILLSLVFLFVQAICELELPNQMSSLVNTGIQSGGIESGAPKALSNDAMRLVTAYLNDARAEEFRACYKATDNADCSDYPKMTAGYFLEDGEAAETGYNSAMCALLMAMQDMNDGKQSSEGDAMLSDMKADMLYQSLPAIEGMRATGGLDKYYTRADGDPEGFGAQISAGMTSIFYDELGVDLSKMREDYIMKTGLIMLLIALLSVAAAVVVGYISSYVATTAAKNLRRDIYSKVISFANNEFDKFSTASLITRTTNDVQQVQMLLTMAMRIMCFAPIMGIGGVIMALRTSASMSWVIVLAVVILLGILTVIASIAMPKFKILQKLIDRINLVSRENLTGMLVIRAFGNETYEESRFERANDDLRRTNRFVHRTMSMLMPVMMLIMNGTCLLIVWVAAKKITDSTMNIGNMMAFIQYAMTIISSFLMIAMMFIIVPRALVSASRISEVLDTELSITNSDKCVKKNVKGEIEFRDVCFRYHNAEENALEHISFTAKPGETTAFIGATGSGKSTLINLIPRFYDVTAGAIYLDGTDIRELEQEELRRTIGYVPQKGFLFSGDIASNLRFGDENADESALWNALEVAQGKDFVSDFEKGLETEIAQGGTNVSGGQRQRLAIARALLKNSPVYIFDDSFSALDLKTDAALRRALAENTSDATVLIVAQRVSTIRNAEQIIVLDEGRIVGKGTHDELIESCAEYREIAESQLVKEELS